MTWLDKNNVLSQFFVKTLEPQTVTSRQINDIELKNAGTVDYRFEEVRRMSYENWVVPYVQPDDLAAAGFYYTKSIDKVRCFECRTEICRWQEGDDPEVEHRRWGGRCRFVRKLPCGNVPIGADPSTIPYPYLKRDVIRSSYSDKPSLVVGLGLSGMSFTRKPDFDCYSTYEARLNTFKNWPISMPQKKEQLADAGFFYQGTGDQTTCHHCGGGLKNWEPEDDPWVQHAKWFSTCSYLRVVKGQDFINGIVGKHQASLSEKEMLAIKLPSCMKKVDLPGSEELESRHETPSSGKVRSKNTLPITRENDENESQTTLSTVSTLTDRKSAGKSQQDIRADSTLCKICYEIQLGVSFMPCGHILTCVKCAPSICTCPICRKKIDFHARIFLS